MNHPKCWHMDSCPSIRCAHMCLWNWIRLYRQRFWSHEWNHVYWKTFSFALSFILRISWTSLLRVVYPASVEHFYWDSLLQKAAYFTGQLLLSERFPDVEPGSPSPALFNACSDSFPLTYNLVPDVWGQSTSSLESSTFKVNYPLFLYYGLC